MGRNDSSPRGKDAACAWPNRAPCGKTFRFRIRFEKNGGSHKSIAMQRALFRLSGAVPRSASVQQWLDAQHGELGALAREAFDLLRNSGAGVQELMHDGCATACVGDAAFAYVGAYNAHVSVGFFQGTELPDPAGLLEGQGKYMRHVKLKREGRVDRASLEELVSAAHRDVVARLQAHA